MVDAALQAQVDAQLLEQGCYSGLELLFNVGRLGYGDYEAWRRGEIELLDSALMGDPEKIRQQLQNAAAYARSIGLLQQPQEFLAWQSGTGQRPLRISADRVLEQLLGARFAPAADVPQMDLFFDNPVVALSNGIVRALAARNAAEAQRLLDRLYAHAPNHADLAAFDRLLEASSHLGLIIGNPQQELDFLLQVAPLAKRLLGARARDLLAPLWRQLAVALVGLPFDPQQPSLHRSFALGEAQDWAALSECIVREPHWWQHVALCLRLAQSSFYQQRRTEALKAWCHLCWRAPQQAAQALERPLDRNLAALWQQFCDSEQEDELSAADFPAWLLLHEPGLAEQLPADLPPQQSAGEQHYRYVHQWQHARRAQREDEELALRRTLRAAQPVLFAKLKRTV